MNTLCALCGHPYSDHKWDPYNKTYDCIGCGDECKWKWSESKRKRKSKRSRKGKSKNRTRKH